MERPSGRLPHLSSWKERDEHGADVGICHGRIWRKTALQFLPSPNLMSATGQPWRRGAALPFNCSLSSNEVRKKETSAVVGSAITGFEKSLSALEKTTAAGSATPVALLPPDLQMAMTSV
ncbi:hypothetical protein ACLOJK_028304 [Asimina triloba]